MRVICVDDSSPASSPGIPSGLVKWKEYDVETCGHAAHVNESADVAGFIVPGVPTPHRNDCWRQSRFRPIKEVDVNAMFRCEETVNA